MHQAVRHDAIERRGDLQIGLHVLLALARRPRRHWLACWRELTNAWAASTCFSAWISLVAGDRAGRFGGFLQALVGALRGRELRFGLQPVRFGGLHLGLGFGDLRLHFRSAQFGQEVALFHDAAAIHQDALDIARALWRAARRSRNGRNSPGRSTVRETGLETTGASSIVCGHSGAAAKHGQKWRSFLVALHNIGSRDPSD